MKLQKHFLSNVKNNEKNMNEEILKKIFGYDNPYAKDLDRNNEAS